MLSWLKNAVFYEIYPQSFYDTNGDGIGDLEGIIRKLDYIRQLGCNAIWINPCFDSPFYDAGYDVRDYRKIASRYGTNEDMRRLFQEAHDRGIRVLLDLVPGHTSIEHEWFKRSMHCDEEYADRYIWADGPWERFEGVACITGCISGFCQRGSCAVNFYSTQPALNYGFAKPDPQKHWQISVDSPHALATRAAMLDVMRFWLAMGCDGFRVDMAGALVKGDDDQSATIRLWREISAILNTEFPEAALISEWGDPKRSLSAGFHMDFLLHFGPSDYMSLFREQPYFMCKSESDISNFVAGYTEMLQSAGADGFICIPSGNHDMSRIAHHLNANELRLAFAFLLSVPGAPFIYYGDEIGMRYLEDLPSIEGGYQRTGARTPMQWDGTLNAGFSSAKPEDLYTPIDPAADRPTVESQMSSPGSLWNEVRTLIALRQAHKALQNDSPIEFISYGAKNSPLVYRRGKGSGSIVVALNLSVQKLEIEMRDAENMKTLYSIGGSYQADGGKVTLAPGSAVFFQW